MLTATSLLYIPLFISEELRGQSVIIRLAGNKRLSELFFPFQMPTYIRTAWTHSQVLNWLYDCSFRPFSSCAAATCWAPLIGALLWRAASATFSSVFW